MVSIGLTYLGIVSLCYLILWQRDSQKIVKSLNVARKNLVKLLPMLLAIFGLVGLFQEFVPPQLVTRYLSESSGLSALFIGSVVGAVSIGPPLAAYPLAEALLKAGAWPPAIAAFILSWISIGVITLPFEAMTFSWRFALLREHYQFLCGHAVRLVVGVAVMIKSLIRSQWLLLMTIGIYCWSFIVSPERAARALEHGLTTFLSVILLILAVFCLVGLLQVWISRDLIVRVLGRDSGVRGLVIAAFCGTLLIGPAYIVFPLLMEIQKRGARWAVVAIVLTSYAVKLQMLPVEIEFLGWPFALGRALIIIAMAIPVGLLIEAFMDRSSRPL